MSFSMHSHSGQFCPGHAQDDLEKVVQTAISRGMISFALTEHMPRNSDADRYPDEVRAPVLPTTLLTSNTVLKSASHLPPAAAARSLPHRSRAPAPKVCCPDQDPDRLRG
jgi:histidinol phosphatase-like PHP family hydrolase